MFFTANRFILTLAILVIFVSNLPACKTTESGVQNSVSKICYARCNLKVLKGKQITWVNWQAAPSFIPINTELRVNKYGNRATLTITKTGKEYALDIGGKQNFLINKFISEVPIDLSNISDEINKNIKRGVARLGMTKHQVYYAMGPPTWIPDGKTYQTSYDEIMTADLWVYARRKFGKKIGVQFNPVDGEVIETEGIWK